jgi:hypothetical protein
VLESVGCFSRGQKVLKSADVCYESGHFLPPRKTSTDSNTFSRALRVYFLLCCS